MREIILMILGAIIGGTIGHNFFGGFSPAAWYGLVIGLVIGLLSRMSNGAGGFDFPDIDFD